MEFRYVTIYVEKLDESVHFFKEVMGFKLTRRFSPGEGMEIAFLDGEGTTGIELISQEGFVGSHDALTLTYDVEDMSGEIARFKEKGIEVKMGPVPLGNGAMMTRFEDPNGIKIGLISHP